jgi:hypothetical protein
VIWPGLEHSNRREGECSRAGRFEIVEGAEVGMIYSDGRPGWDSNVYPILRQIQSRLRTVVVSVNF